MKLVNAKKIVVLVMISMGFAVVQTHSLFAQERVVPNSVQTSITPRVLLIDPWKNNIPCGVVLTTLGQAKTFNAQGTYLLTMFRKRSIHEKLFKQHELPSMPLTDGLVSNVLKAYDVHGINVVVTYKWEDIPFLKAAAQYVPIKVIFYRIATLEEDELRRNFTVLRDIDGFIGNADVVEEIKKANIRLNLGIRHFKVITPFWNEQKCLGFSTQETRENYFKRRFDINLAGAPVCCTLANLVCECKNYPLLLQAIQHLVYKKQLKIHAMIAGSGPLKEGLMNLARKLQIESYVHFLDSIDDTPALLYHSDMHVLPSYFDSFPLANLEAACMKKPIIVASEISAAAFVINQETGLHFRTQDSEDLADKIAYLIEHPDQRKRMGENAYKHVLQNYSNVALYTTWMEFLHEIFADKKQAVLDHVKTILRIFPGVRSQW